MDLKLSPVKALAFDVFGTVVDWRESIIAEGAELNRRLGLSVAWDEFADAWRAGYAPAMQRVRSGESPWTPLDDLHRMNLDGLLQRFALTDLPEAEIDHLNQVWHRLQPWPDSVAGLGRLRSRYIVASLSNGNVALLVDMARNAGLPWDCVLSAELVQRYKPDERVYRMAAELLRLEPRQVMMVAAHNQDLRAAADAGLRTAFVARPLEFGPAGQAEREAAPFVDVAASDFHDLADQLGA